ncbi:MAG: hypothetical protein ACQPRJ_02380 [Solitalea-like symbiont of Acarus siro]
MDSNNEILEKLRTFFARKGINASGVCAEAKVSYDHVRRVLTGKLPLTKQTLNKLLPVIAE